jgi:hypothetical protein
MQQVQITPPRGSRDYIHRRARKIDTAHLRLLLKGPADSLAIKQAKGHRCPE